MGFFSSLGSLVSSLGSGLSSGSLPLGDWSGGWTNFSSNQSKLKDAYKRQYDYSQRYATESPSWVVEGLRSAGLNPILALQDGSITGASTPNPSLPSGDGSGQLSLGGKSKAERNLIDAQITSAKRSADNLEANSDKLRNDIAVSKAQLANETALNNARIENIRQDTINKGYTGGHSGVSAGINAIGHVLRETGEGALDWTKNDISKTIEGVKRIGASISNSARDWFNGKKAIENLPKSSIEDAPAWFRSALQRERDKDSHKKAYRHHH